MFSMNSPLPLYAHDKRIDRAKFFSARRCWYLAQHYRRLGRKLEAIVRKW